MKKIFKFMLLPALVLPLMLTSCDDDHDSNPTMDLSHVNELFKLNTPANAANNTYDLASAEYLTLTCTQPNYGGVPYPVRYYVQTSLENNFEDSTKFTELNTSYTSAKLNVDANELNTAVCALYQQGNTDVKVPADQKIYLRLRAYIDGTADESGIHGMGESYSNVIELPHVCATYVKPLATIPAQLYLQGASINGGAYKVVPPIFGLKSSSSNNYFGVVYMPAGGTLKWGPEKTDMRGFSRINSIDDVASAGVSADADDNVTFTNAGWYTLVFDDNISADEEGRLTVSTFDLHVYPTHAYIIGSVWDSANWTDSDPTAELTAPADNTGEWVSPAFQGSGEMRAYVKVTGQDWWRTEFTIYNNSIYWRLADIPSNWEENVGAEYSVKGSPGQKLYVNFDTGAARVE